MKAWVGTDYHRDAAAVVFADTRGKARALAAMELDRDFTELDELRREPRFDGRDPEELTPAFLSAHGWNHDCCHYACRERVWSDEAVIHGTEVFCSAACRDETLLMEMGR